MEKERKSRERGHKGVNEGGKGGQGREREETLSYSLEQISPSRILMERRQILAHFRTLPITKLHKHYLLFLLKIKTRKYHTAGFVYTFPGSLQTISG